MLSLMEGIVVFFFSSRRRHTIFSRDWSSDVCSSDLPGAVCSAAAAEQTAPGLYRRRPEAVWLLRGALRPFCLVRMQIGRASCRVRGQIWGDGVSLDSII